MTKNRKNRLWAALITLCLLAPPAHGQEAEPEEAVTTPPATTTTAEEITSTTKKFLTLTQGSTHLEPVPNIPGNADIRGDFKKVVTAELDKGGKRILFKPKAIGFGTLTISTASGKKVYEFRIEVRRSDLDKAAREIRAQLSDIEGIEVKIINNKVVVDGQILLPKDMNRIQSVLRLYEGLATSWVRISPLAQKKIAELIERHIQNPEVHVRAVNEKFILEGYVGDPADKQRAEIIAKTYVPDVLVEQAEADGVIRKRKVDAVINMIEVRPAPAKPPGKIVQLVVHFVELQKDYQKGFRFQWTPDLDDGSSLTFKAGNREPGAV